MIKTAKNIQHLISDINENINKESSEILFSFAHSIVPIKIHKKKPLNVVLKKIDSFENVLLYGYINLQNIQKTWNRTQTRFIESSKTYQQFSIIDGKIISFLNPNKKSKCFGQTIHNQHLGTKYKKEFFNIYNNAIPVSLIINEIEKEKKCFIQKASLKLTKSEIVFLENMIDYGFFASYTNKEKERFLKSKSLTQFIKKIKTEVVANLQINFLSIREKYDTNK